MKTQSKESTRVHCIIASIMDAGIKDLTVSMGRDYERFGNWNQTITISILDCQANISLTEEDFYSDKVLLSIVGSLDSIELTK